MERNIYNDLLNWKNNPNKKPLLVLGQRQIGKTYIISEFAKNEYKYFIYLNFMNNKNHKEIFNDLGGIDDLINEFSLNFNVDKRNLNDYLFFFDEIQECNNAITSLKMINESNIKINVICSGSYLGYSIKSSYLNFPIGQVDFLYMKQMMFDEFICAINKQEILNQAIDAVKNKKEIRTLFHNELLKWFNEYLIIGGFPEVIKKYIENQYNIKVALDTLASIFIGYENDINKYSQLFQSKTFLNIIYQNINKFLIKENKKFVFQDLDRSSKYRELEKYLVWMDKSNLVLKINNLKNLSFPLINNVSDNNFKLYYNDHGFLSLNYDLNSEISIDKFNIIKGGLCENYVAVNIYQQFKHIFYYSFILYGKRYEVDFVVQDSKSNPCLIEVKSSDNIKTKSLNKINNNIKKYVLSISNYFKNDQYTNIPIYLCFMLKEILDIE